MKFNSTKMLLLNSMVIGVTMVICSNNWLMMWAGMEITLLSFIPMMQSKMKLSSESLMKYFIIQSMSSTIFLLGVIFMLIGVNMFNYLTIISTSMMIKIGLFPFHNWVLMIIEGLEFNEIFKLLTIIKMPLLTILSYTEQSTTFFSLTSMIFSSIMSLNQSSLRKILVFSSIYNNSIMIFLTSSSLWLVFFLIYSMMVFTVIKMFNNLKLSFINQIMINEFKPFLKLNIWLSIMSLAGFPPLLGFFSKIIALEFLMKKMSLFSSMVLVLTSIILMFFYMRLMFSSMMVFSISIKWKKQTKNKFYFLMMMNMFMPMMLWLLKSIF